MTILFSIVAYKDIFDHLLNPDVVLTEIYSVLRPNSLFLFHATNHFRLIDRLNFL